MTPALERFFQPKSRNSSVKNEILAGFTTFSTMAYIIVVNPLILSQTGMDFGAVMVATILSAVLATFIMGAYANYPFCQAPGMGLNAYFTYGIVLGSGHSWQVALGACFLAGILFLVLNIFRLRQLIMAAIPFCLRVSVSAGIGLFLAFIGMKNIGLIDSHSVTFVTLGDITSPPVYMTGIGIIVTAALLARGYRAAIFIGIVLNWVIGLATGLCEWKGVVALPPSILPTFGQLDIIGALRPELLGVVFSLLFIAVFDTAGSLIGLAEQGNFLDDEGKLPRANRALVTDAFGSIFGALFGTSMTTTYLESASGIAAGGRTGLTAIVVALLFLLSLFFAPLASSIPLFATAPVIIIIGAMMLSPIRRLNWNDPSEFIPAFIVIASIPLTFSIATGIGLGIISYPLIKLLSGKRKETYWLQWVLAGLFILEFVMLK